MKMLNELKQKLENAKNAAKELVANENATLEEIQAKDREIESLQARIKVLEKTEPQDRTENTEIPLDNPENNIDYKTVFMKAFKGQPLSAKESDMLKVQGALSSATGEDGGYLIPIDQQTRVNELKRSLPALENYVKVEPVRTLTGSRNIEKNALYTPFQEFTEGNDVPASDAPQFTNIPYAIKDRGGILPVPNNLMNDSDIAIESYLNSWLAKKSVATRNKLILDLLNTLTKVPVTDLTDLKEIFNIELDPAIEASAKVFTNQDGFNWLDTLKDAEGKFMVQPNPLEPTKKMLFGKYEIVVLSNKAMATRNDGTNYQAPIIIGDMEEAVVLFDREQMSLLSTNIGGQAFTKNRTDIRAIQREDVKMFDSEAVVFAEINVGTV
ncbi:HK97 family phage major capsid protein [Acetoanaerobium pronyense]|uniref:HK97 family phage major capsid protein n=1 Tax=Acetoanaerobium pronyense TaxID=1482736 RepID=A0ABS4KJW8_9FIRM|nr:phage major capsid protein [Acetoanaerobium pronyense]MBP2027406.1 HK97 family phage major capsid protein [Acetoanaerobium pronyense]